MFEAGKSEAKKTKMSTPKQQSLEEDLDESTGESLTSSPATSNVVGESQLYFFGIELSDEKREFVWQKPFSGKDDSTMSEDSDPEVIVHCLQLRGLCLGSGAIDNERNIVTVEAEQADGGELVPIVIASLRAGGQEMANIELDFQDRSAVRIVLSKGSGPVHITGMHEKLLGTDEDEDYDYDASMNREGVSDAETASEAKEESAEESSEEEEEEELVKRPEIKPRARKITVCETQPPSKKAKKNKQGAKNKQESEEEDMEEQIVIKKAKKDAKIEKPKLKPKSAKKFK